LSAALELPPAAAAELVAFLHELTDALERHYGAQIKHHYEATARHRVPTAATIHRSDPLTAQRSTEHFNPFRVTIKMTRVYNPATAGNEEGTGS